MPDLTQVEDAVQTLAPYLRANSVVINKSTVPVGWGDWTRTMLEESLPRDRQPTFHVVSNPEFLREGSAIADFLHPDRVVLGGDDTGVQRVADLYRPAWCQPVEAIELVRRSAKTSAGVR
jgi:UDPglucose 6-dehydrogenase